MSRMHEIAVSDLQVSDIGARVIAIDKAGNAYDGHLSEVAATSWQWGKRPEDSVRSRITIRSGEGSELKLNELPLDFRIQVWRETPEHQIEDQE